MEAIIQTYQLRKVFKEAEIIKPLDFTLKKGEICALIGKNGAGKSTFFKMLSGQLQPTSGEIQLFGQSKEALTRAQRRMGFMIESPTFFPDFSAVQNLEYFRLQRGIVDRKKIDEVLQIVGLNKQKQKKFKAYSMGMKQRLGIALCLLSQPDCLVLDEPINGLDTEGIIEVRNLLLKLNTEKHMTILVSSHILTELQLVANRFVFMKYGEIVEDLSKEELARKSKKQLYIHVDQPAKAAQLLERTYADIQYQVLPNGAFVIQNYIEEAAQMNQLLVSHALFVTEVRVETIKLEDYFLELVGDQAYD